MIRRNPCSPPAPHVGPALTIGMATYDDYFGVWATCQSLHNARVEAGLVDQIEIVVIDNNPNGTHGETTKGQVNAYKPHAQYLEFTDHQGTSGPRNKVFEVARGRGVVVIDPHVLFVKPVETLRKLVEFWTQPETPVDLFHGPCLHDALIDQHHRPYIVGTHWSAEWGGDGMFGKWATAEPYHSDPHRINDPDAKPIEVPLNACGLFMAARDSWLGFHPEQRGFGAEEGTIHYKYRHHGRATFVLPWLQWVHRWGKPERVAYGGMQWKTRCRNYLLSTRDFGWPNVAELRAVFVIPEPRHIAPNGDPHLATTGQHRVSEADWESLLTEMGLSDSASPPPVSNVAHVVELKLLDPDPGLQPWEAEYLDNEATFGCLFRENRLGSVMCNIGCPSMQSQPVSLYQCAAHQAPVTLARRRTDLNHCVECSLRLPRNPLSLDDLYQRAANTPSDINEHCPKLKELATGAGTVIEFGMRHGVSTVALLAGQPKVLISCDINHDPIAEELKAVQGETDFQFVRADSLTVEPRPCDVLFIDTRHTEAQLYVELKRHARFCSTHIGLHDTQTFGERGEDGGPGLLVAVRRFLQEHPDWSITFQTPVNNGLTILTRSGLSQ